MTVKRDQQESVAAVPSATVVIVRPGAQAPELLMVRRRAGDVFGDSYAFPGGLVDHDEALSYPRCRGVSPREANASLGIADGGLDYYVAAIRELFEETGVLLVRNRPPAAGPALQELRTQVDRGILPWSEFLRGQELYMACDALQYFAHWETPLAFPKRWSARFFMASMPEGQDVLHDGTELTDSRWLSVAEALSLDAEGHIKLPFPTLRNLRKMAGFNSVDALFDWARQQARQGVETFRPIQISKDGELIFVVRDDTDYPEGGDE